jgi:hypothetical protein
VILADAIDTLRELVVEPLPAGIADARPLAAVAYDSRRVVPAAIFVALKGLKADGRVPNRPSPGCQAVSPNPRPGRRLHPWLVVQRAPGLALLRSLRSPDRRMPVVGVWASTARLPPHAADRDARKPAKAGMRTVA